MGARVRAMLVVAVVLDVAYWTAWFVDRDLVASSHRAAYVEFENAFPLADLWLGVACVGALVALRGARPSARFWITVAGGAGMYLFCTDLLYDLQHAIFTSGAGGVVEAGIVAVTLAFSLTALWVAWGWDSGRALTPS